VGVLLCTDALRLSPPRSRSRAERRPFHEPGRGNKDFSGLRPFNAKPKPTPTQNLTPRRPEARPFGPRYKPISAGVPKPWCRLPRRLFGGVRGLIPPNDMARAADAREARIGGRAARFAALSRRGLRPLDWPAPPKRGGTITTGRSPFKGQPKIIDRDENSGSIKSMT